MCRCWAVLPSSAFFLYRRVAVEAWYVTLSTNTFDACEEDKEEESPSQRAGKPQFLAGLPVSGRE